ncbi:related to alpha-glucosidases, family 31 of glycosyl hydrolases [Ramularia collo-cygni]|uniref:Related to alpha-glucosidases, family 31 of glycosyl hydrolases n=1 Tax=Ramularia collo-cygni TaxID=112498 RepID=A0A2D3VPZ3_9PEZI|nr:related to alpha-glucosidases, family 31 of glycosyl hydrolases [Ramularia collo-cygni]CZT25254.1 related to alpha-glucosidases, family 31 of glycosyl hydrolases [Ramularia collo-cygni]
MHALFAVFGLFVCAGSTQNVLASSYNESFDIGEAFVLTRNNDLLEITQSGEAIWSTVPGNPFISASAGNDSIVGSNGAFNITHIDIDICQDQDISSIQQVPWDGTVTGKAVQITGHLTDCGHATAPYSLTLWVSSDLPDRVAFYIDISASSNEAQPLKKLYFSFASSAGEDFFGLGGQASFASLKNQSIPVFTREQGVGRGDQPITSIENANGSISGGDFFTAYTAVASYISTEASLFYLSEKSTGYANFDFTQSESVTVRYDSLSVDGAFTRKPNMFDAIEALTEYTGRMPALPKWVDDGAILGIQGGQDKVISIVEQGLDPSINAPIAGVWLQDWCGTHIQPGPYSPAINVSRLWWNWENDEMLYPTWNEFVQDLRDNHNVRTLSYMNVFLANVSTKPTGFRRNLYDEASASHYFVQNSTTNSTAIISSGPGLNAGIIDLTNPGLREWFKDILRSQVWDANISGFMTDFGEYTPVTSDVQQYGSDDAFFTHNAYPAQWAEIQHSVVEELGLESEALLFHRSASTGSNRNMNLFWVGDQNVDWGVHDGIKSVVTLMVHMGFSGYSQQHSDVGGYTTVLTLSNYNVTRSPELLGRWGELAAVSSAVFRSHEGNIPSVNAQFYSNSSTYSYYAYNARMFVSLAKYRRSILETECEPKGWPLLRSPALYHPTDLRARQISYQSFYLGSSLYVAPVLDPDTFEVKVYLPGTGTFHHVWTGAMYEGGQNVVVSAPYGKPAVFLVDGANTTELQPFLEFVKNENGTLLSVE